MTQKHLITNLTILFIFINSSSSMFISPASLIGSSGSALISSPLISSPENSRINPQKSSSSFLPPSHRFRFNVEVSPEDLAPTVPRPIQTVSTESVRPLFSSPDSAPVQSELTPKFANPIQSNLMFSGQRFPERRVKVSKVSKMLMPPGRYTRRLDCALFCRTTGFHGSIGGCTCGFSLFKRRWILIA